LVAEREVLAAIRILMAQALPHRLVGLRVDWLVEILVEMGERVEVVHLAWEQRNTLVEMVEMADQTPEVVVLAVAEPLENLEQEITDQMELEVRTLVQTVVLVMLETVVLVDWVQAVMVVLVETEQNM
jgi:hypothetical protein